MRPQWLSPRLPCGVLRVVHLLPAPLGAPLADAPFEGHPEAEVKANPSYTHPNVWPSAELPELEPALPARCAAALARPSLGLAFRRLPRHCCVP